MREHTPAPPGDADFLTVQVAGGPHEPDRLMMISRPESGEVVVREWTAQGWNGEPAERRIGTDELYAWMEQAARERRRMSEELYRVRLWLGASDR